MDASKIQTRQDMQLTHGRKIMRNTGVLTIGEMTALIAGWLWTVIVARYIGPETYGFYSYVHSTLAVFVIFINLGLDRLLTRDVAQQPAAGWSYLVTFTFIKIVLSVLVLGGFLAYVYLSGKSGEHAEIILILTAMWFVNNLFMLAIAFLYAYEAMHYAVIGQVLNALLTFGTGAVAVWLKQPFVVVLWLSLAASVVQMIVCYVFAARFREGPPVGLRFALLPFATMKKLIIDSTPFAALVMASAINANLMILLLRHLTADDTSVGYLSAAIRIYSVAVIIPSMLSRSVFPAMAATYANSTEEFISLFARSYRYVNLISVPLGFGLWAVAPQVLELVYGHAFAPAGPLLRILALALVGGLGYAAAPALEAMRRQTLGAFAFCGLVLCSAAVGYWAIPQFGAEGAAWAPVIGSGVGFFLYAVLLFRILHLHYPFAWITKIFLAAIVMSAVAVVAVAQVHLLIVVFLIGPLTYIGILLALRTLTADDWAFFYSLVPDMSRRMPFFNAVRRHLGSNKTDSTAV